MLTRGYFIGEIVDALSDVSGQVSTRGRLGLTDLNKHAEDFYKTILNHLYSYSLENLNEERSNAPGLDLGDRTNRVAFQVTAERTSAKVNETLERLSTEQIATFKTIRVLMIAGKQSSYTLDPDLCARVGFEVGDIWDVDHLCKRAMDLQIDVLQRLYNYVHAELARVKIELEIPDAEGNYPTNLNDYTEAIPKRKMSDLTKFNKYLGEEGEGESVESTRADFEALSSNLEKLPRITREFLTMMIERREMNGRSGIGRSNDVEVNADKLKRISHYPDRDGELRVLGSYEFIFYDEPDYQGKSPHWSIGFPDTSNHFILSFLDFAERKGIALNGPLVNLDFSEF